ncbi:hypothetical protein Tco_1405488 [Tanacetum coccineum]
MGREKGPEEKDFLLGYPKIKKRGGKDDSMAEGRRERTHAWIFCLSEVPESMKGNLKLRLRSKGSPREVVISSCLLGESAEPSTVTVDRDYAKVEHHRNFADFLINLDFATLNKKPE